jgi:hypothetical protein
MFPVPQVAPPPVEQVDLHVRKFVAEETRVGGGLGVWATGFATVESDVQFDPVTGMADVWMHDVEGYADKTMLREGDVVLARVFNSDDLSLSKLWFSVQSRIKADPTRSRQLWRAQLLSSNGFSLLKDTCLVSFGPVSDNPIDWTLLSSTVEVPHERAWRS